MHPLAKDTPVDRFTGRVCLKKPPLGKLGSRYRYYIKDKPLHNQMTFDMHKDVSSIKYAQKSVPGLADVEVPHGVGVGPRTPPRCLEGSGKSFK